MLKHLMIFVLGMTLVGLIGCSIRTPEIQGLVLDEETKQPVPEAWIAATIGVKTKTIAGDVGQVISLDPPHTRTDKEGRFVIPRKKLKKPPFPVSFGSEIDSLGIGARTVEDKDGGIEFRGEKLKEFIRKRSRELTIFIKPTERNESEYFSHLQSLYKYCLTGRFGIEVPPVEGGCDEWELNYAVSKHEAYMKKYKIIAEQGQAKGYFTAMEQLSELYDKKRDFKKAIDILKGEISLMEKRGLLRFQDWQRDKTGIENKINELQQKLNGVRK